MKYYFFDSSAIVKLYIPEVGSDKTKELFEYTNVTNLLSILSWAEVPSAILSQAISLIKQGADLTLITSDRNILQVALKEGIKVINPEDVKVNIFKTLKEVLPHVKIQA